MKIAFVHYHLKTGGVATVLKRQIAAIQVDCEPLLLTGERAAAQWPCKVVEIPELGYDPPGVSPPSPEMVADRVLKALSKLWPGGCDVLHVHNPTLAKNRQFLKIIKRLQQAGVNLFLQIHDFAEDGRPDFYFDEDYPEDCHYGVINGRDARILMAAGLDAAGLHQLPNAVEGFRDSKCRDTRPQVLYPIRAIRRKNLGEALLVSLFFKDGQRLAITQPPNSPADIHSYRDWIQWVRASRLPVDFAAGKDVDFNDLLRRSESVLTTSITEGFGLAFLEPWTAGKLLWGRRLKTICDDFESRGLCLDALYDRLDVPLAWIDADAFSGHWHTAVARAAARFGHTIAAEQAVRAFGRMTHGGVLDFGMLNELFQRKVLWRLIVDPSAKAELVSLNPWLSTPGAFPGSAAIIENNRRVVLQHFGQSNYRVRLLEVYDKVVNHPVSHRIDKSIVRDALFDLDHFPLLKWSAYEGT